MLDVLHILERNVVVVDIYRGRTLRVGILIGHLLVDAHVFLGLIII